MFRFVSVFIWVGLSLPMVASASPGGDEHGQAAIDEDGAERRPPERPPLSGDTAGSEGRDDLRTVLYMGLGLHGAQMQYSHVPPVDFSSFAPLPYSGEGWVVGPAAMFGAGIGYQLTEHLAWQGRLLVSGAGMWRGSQSFLGIDVVAEGTFRVGPFGVGLAAGYRFLQTVTQGRERRYWVGVSNLAFDAAFELLFELGEQDDVELALRIAGGLGRRFSTTLVLGVGL